jgi:hypothetical protein
MSKQCSAKNTGGKRCGAWAVTGQVKCALHLDPERAAKMGSMHGRTAALPSQPDAAPMEPPKTASDVRDALARTMAQVHARKMDTRTANALAYVARVNECNHCSRQFDQGATTLGEWVSRVDSV